MKKFFLPFLSPFLVRVAVQQLKIMPPRFTVYYHFLHSAWVSVCIGFQLNQTLICISDIITRGTMSYNDNYPSSARNNEQNYDVMAKSLNFENSCLNSSILKFSLSKTNS